MEARPSRIEEARRRAAGAKQTAVAAAVAGFLGIEGLLVAVAASTTCNEARGRGGVLVHRMSLQWAKPTRSS